MWVRPVRSAITLALLLGGCQLVGDIGERDLACQPAKPVTSGPRARIANLAISGTKVEVCFDSGARLPIQGPGCAAGVGYAEVSAPARVQPGAQHVRVIPAGAGCDASPLFEADVELADGGNTLAWMGGGSRPNEELRAFPEREPSAGHTLVRVIHAAPELGLLDAGAADAAGLPATIASPLHFVGLEFGELAAPTNLVGENGYVDSIPGIDLRYGTALSGETEAKFVSSISRETSIGHSFSIFAIGGGARPHQSLLCDEQRFTKDRSLCSVGEPVEIGFELFNAVISGLLLPYAAERKAALAARINDFDSDVVCLEELWPETTKQEVAAAAAVRYPHQYSVVYDPTSPFTDATGLGGTPPPPPRTEPYCASAESKQKLESLIECLREDCASPASDAGLVQQASCPTTTCIAESQGLLPHLDCGLCAIYLIGGSTLAELREGCTVTPQPYAFDGASGLLLLSRFPLEEASEFLAPSTLLRRDVIHARVRHPNGVAADVFCGYSPPIPAGAELYPGVYGDGADNGEDAWRNERKLFTEKLFAWVDSTQRAPRSVVMGVFGTSPIGAGFEALEPDVYQLLTQRFPLAVPPGFVPSCTSCLENPLALRAHFVDLVMMRGAGVVTGVQITHKSATVSAVNSLGTPVKVPLSSHYGFRSRIRFSP